MQFKSLKIFKEILLIVIVQHFFLTFYAQGLNFQILSGMSNFHNESGKNKLIWQPSFTFGIKARNKNSLCVGLNYEDKGASKNFENWKFNLKYISINIGKEIRAKDSKTTIDFGPYFSLLASLDVKSENLRAVGYARNSFKKYDYGIYFDYSNCFAAINKLSLGLTLKVSYGLLDIFHDSAILITTQENKWTRNFMVVFGLNLLKI
jgi:hypothetical protein